MTLRFKIHVLECLLPITQLPHCKKKNALFEGFLATWKWTDFSSMACGWVLVIGRSPSIYLYLVNASCVNRQTITWTTFERLATIPHFVIENSRPAINAVSIRSQ